MNIAGLNGIILFHSDLEVYNLRLYNQDLKVNFYLQMKSTRLMDKCSSAIMT